MFRELCWNQRNNPSILLWSVGNEPMYYLLTTGKLKGYVKDLHEDLDGNYPDGRLVTMSLAADGVKVTGGAIDDLDVVGFTMYYGVFYGDDATGETRAFLEEQHRLRPDKPMIVCEFGTWPGLRDQGEQDQVIIGEKTLDGMLPLAAVDEQGRETAGFLASTVWWCQFNWYRVDREAPVQNMGTMGMDRTTQKEVWETLAARFKPYYDMGGVAQGE
jgi:beta-galactosidase